MGYIRINLLLLLLFVAIIVLQANASWEKLIESSPICTVYLESR